ncbi:class C sortase [Bifidobacterium aquikefiricola]|uniref:Class C sortase n=2 Tax=Bifidobacterium TaxID=1678 RepID=A0AB39U8F0_9BIFI
MRSRKPVNAPQGPSSAHATRKTWHFQWYAFIPALLVLVGLFVLTYPSTASWFSQYDESRLIDANIQQIKSGNVSPSIKQQLAQAHAYNDALSAGAILEANHRIPTGSGTSTDPNAELDYNKILVDPTGMMARIRIPSIRLDLPIYHGTSDAVLQKGIGHLEGTSLPVGGKGTHAVLAGHRGLATATLFTNLDKVKKGNTFTIEVLGETLTYKVFEIAVVDPGDTAALKAFPGKDLVTLVTCTPLGINSQRILVTGERVNPTPKAELQNSGKQPDIPGFPWWAVIQGSAILLAALFVWRSGIVNNRATSIPDIRGKHMK